MAKPSEPDVRKHKKSKKDKSAARAPESEGAKAGGFSLLGGASAEDKELDDVFSKGSAFAVPAVKRPVPDANIEVPVTQEKEAKKGKKREPKQSKLKGKPVENVITEEDVAPAPVEAGPSTARARPSSEPADVEMSDAESASGDDDDELVHESLKSPSSSSKKAKARSTAPKKYTPPDETAQDRDRRTVFVGNLPLDVAKTKSIQHRLRAHLLQFAPSAKVESMRFRSVPFATRTSTLEASEEASRREKREKERAAAWKDREEGKGKKRSAAADEEAAEDRKGEKVFIDSKGKRKVAFIKKDFHSEGAACNAYVVFAHPQPDRPANLPPITDPFEAARAVLAANGTTFESRTIRVDSVGSQASSTSTASTGPPRGAGWLPGDTDPKKSLFVGGLDYAAKEEDVRVFFEELVKGERGARVGGGKWVTGVRIVRDKETQLGKGFGYVHFSDAASVDEMLAIDMKKLKFAKKPLRVQRCKALPGAKAPSRPTQPLPSSKPQAGAAGKPKFTPAKAAAAKPAVMPKGDPTLGARLASLSKEERKAAKQSDADRQARRMAKKKLRAGMEKEANKGAVKLSLSKGEKDRGKKKKNVGGNKGRKRSENAVGKMKGARV